MNTALTNTHAQCHTQVIKSENLKLNHKQDNFPGDGMVNTSLARNWPFRVGLCHCLSCGSNQCERDKDGIIGKDGETVCEKKSVFVNASAGCIHL